VERKKKEEREDERTSSNSAQRNGKIRHVMTDSARTASTKKVRCVKVERTEYKSDGEERKIVKVHATLSVSFFFHLR
jgi:hypothetical protein